MEIYHTKNKPSETAFTAFPKAYMITISLGFAVIVVCSKILDWTCAERVLSVPVGYGLSKDLIVRKVNEF